MSYSLKTFFHTINQSWLLEVGHDINTKTPCPFVEGAGNVLPYGPEKKRARNLFQISRNLKTRTNQTGRIPQKHLEIEINQLEKTDDSTSCRETAPGPSNGQQNKVANATSF
ncbi:hypothetical protein J6590_020829 [Homalodisca vitripennis]|nr:hypothetical protein J6590_020829 [Homalodisca vitripennis]